MVLDAALGVDLELGQGQRALNQHLGGDCGGLDRALKQDGLFVALPQLLFEVEEHGPGF